ncbi:hypothetical protein HMPREF9120_02912 [Neisseria sp. oral taxon 020 str. F0370]|nr:hypothetical protein HMPREF9120_02912 [Neisseria sp. oral taxon 020 str. F0370]
MRTWQAGRAAGKRRDFNGFSPGLRENTDMRPSENPLPPRFGQAPIARYGGLTFEKIRQ